MIFTFFLLFTWILVLPRNFSVKFKEEMRFLNRHFPNINTYKFSVSAPILLFCYNLYRRLDYSLFLVLLFVPFFCSRTVRNLDLCQTFFNLRILHYPLYYTRCLPFRTLGPSDTLYPPTCLEHRLIFVWFYGCSLFCLSLKISSIWVFDFKILCTFLSINVGCISH